MSEILYRLTCLSFGRERRPTRPIVGAKLRRRCPRPAARPWGGLQRAQNCARFLDSPLTIPTPGSGGSVSKRFGLFFRFNSADRQRKTLTPANRVLPDPEFPERNFALRIHRKISGIPFSTVFNNPGARLSLFPLWRPLHFRKAAS